MVEAVPPEEHEPDITPAAIIEEAQERDAPPPSEKRADPGPHNWEAYNSRYQGLTQAQRSAFPSPDKVKDGAIPSLLQRMARVNS